MNASSLFSLLLHGNLKDLDALQLVQQMETNRHNFVRCTEKSTIPLLHEVSTKGLISILLSMVHKLQKNYML